MSEINVSMQQVAVVILNYNSEQDVMISAPQLASQKDVSSRLIIVDNASHPESVEKIKSWLIAWRPDAIIGTKSEVDTWVSNNPEKARAPGQVYFILNHENRGYSAGNNIGIRLAETLGADAILIANPDIRITDDNYLSLITQKLFSSAEYVVAASAIKNLSGINENPMRELGFFEELFWPFWMMFSRFGLPPPSQRKRLLDKCKKVSGCCLLIKTSFLKSIGYFDEGVFLYCEEAILAAQIDNAGKEILYVPELEALHAHKTSEKGDRIKRLTEWVKSRKYYHRHYTNYGPIRRFLLSISHQFLLQMMRIQDRFKTKL